MIRVFNEELSDFTNLVLVQPNNGWTGTNGVITGTSLSAILTGDGTNANPSASYTQTAPIVGHKYYIRVKAKITNSVCAGIYVAYGVANTLIISSIVNGEVMDGSVVITATNTNADSVLLQYYADSATANGKVMELFGLIIIDLTVKYGSGNEPTSITMDKIKPLWSLANSYSYSSTYTRTLCINDFETNGEKVIQPITCLEILEDNVDWRIQLTADLSYVSFLKQDYIIVVNTKENGEQPFRINNVKVDNYEVYLSARHIGYDLNNYVAEMIFGYSYSTGIAYHMNRVLGWSLPVNQVYTTTSNWTSGRVTFKGSSLLDNIYEIVATLGGHLVFDWFDVRIDETVGTDNGVTVEYGKNLEGAEVVEDWDEVCTQIYPIGNNNLLLGTATNMITSATSYDRPYTRKVVFQTDDVVELESLANAYLTLNVVPKLNYKVDADSVQDVGLGDTIYVYSKQFTISTNVLGYTYNPVTQKIVNIEFGNFRKDVKTVFSNITADINELKKSIVQENITMNAKFDYLGATFLGYRGAALSFTTATETKIEVDTTTYNTDTSVFELTGGGIKVKVAGTYLVSVKNSVATTGTTGRLGVSVMHNATQYLLDYNALLNNFQRSVGTHTLVCAVDDMIYLYGYQNSGSSRALDPTLNGNHLQVTKIA